MILGRLVPILEEMFGWKLAEALEFIREFDRVPVPERPAFISRRLRERLEKSDDHVNALEAKLRRDLNATPVELFCEGNVLGLALPMRAKAVRACKRKLRAAATAAANQKKARAASPVEQQAKQEPAADGVGQPAVDGAQSSQNGIAKQEVAENKVPTKESEGVEGGGNTEATEAAAAAATSGEGTQ